MKRLILLPGLLVLASAACACNIPVFRYALERWQPDSCELVVFHDAEFAPQDEQFLREFASASCENGGLANAKIIRVNVDVKSGDGYRPVWETLRGQHSIQLPYLVVRTTLGRGTTVNHWHGSFDEARSAGLLQSPVRRELSDRLLRGDSIVWLLLRSTDKRRSQAARDRLSKSLESLQTKVSLPEGIGLPGSELHSEVPLLIKFSLLEIDPADEREQFLVKLLTGFEPQAVADGEPLLVPVFGRGRALEVIPASELDHHLVEDVTLFLSGACSCQVKEQNPGFDLLMQVDWETQLFGEEGGRLLPARTGARGDNSPALLTIPPGH